MRAIFASIKRLSPLSLYMTIHWIALRELHTVTGKSLWPSIVVTVLYFFGDRIINQGLRTYAAVHHVPIDEATQALVLIRPFYATLTICAMLISGTNEPQWLAIVVSLHGGYWFRRWLEAYT